jgi:hypothetical protein
LQNYSARCATKFSIQEFESNARLIHAAVLLDSIISHWKHVAVLQHNLPEADITRLKPGFAPLTREHEEGASDESPLLNWFVRGKQSLRFTCRGLRSTQIHWPLCRMKRGIARSASIA